MWEQRYAAYEAVNKNRPLIDRVVTVTGLSLEKPSNFRVTHGHPCLLPGGKGRRTVPDDTAKVINGGPMMGKHFQHLDVPVVKGSSGIVLIRETMKHGEKKCSPASAAPNV
jgi:electron transport complex protein RnfC